MKFLIIIIKRTHSHSGKINHISIKSMNFNVNKKLPSKSRSELQSKKQILIISQLVPGDSWQRFFIRICTFQSWSHQLRNVHRLSSQKFSVRISREFHVEIHSNRLLFTEISLRIYDCLEFSAHSNDNVDISGSNSSRSVDVRQNVGLQIYRSKLFVAEMFMKDCII